MLRVTITKKDSNPVSCGRAFVDGEMFEDWDDINPALSVKEIKSRLAKHEGLIVINEIVSKKEKKVV